MHNSAQTPSLKISDPWRVSSRGRHWFPRLFTITDGSLLQFDATVDDAIEGILAKRDPHGDVRSMPVAPGKRSPRPATKATLSPWLTVGCASSVTFFGSADGQVYGMSNDWPPGAADWSDAQPFLVNIPPTALRPNTVSGMVVDHTILRGSFGTLLATLYGHLAGHESTTVCL